jgi:hypothetical protein
MTAERKRFERVAVGSIVIRCFEYNGMFAVWQPGYEVKHTDPTPTVDDTDVTRRVVVTGELFGISVLDQIVVGDRHYYSFKEAGRV